MRNQAWTYFHIYGTSWHLDIIPSYIVSPTNVEERKMHFPMFLKSLSSFSTLVRVLYVVDFKIAWFI